MQGLPSATPYGWTCPPGSVSAAVGGGSRMACVKSPAPSYPAQGEFVDPVCSKGNCIP
jgi:hypothetical protein